jgi:hypothetical protein
MRGARPARGGPAADSAARALATWAATHGRRPGPGPWPALPQVSKTVAQGMALPAGALALAGLAGVAAHLAFLALNMAACRWGRGGLPVPLPTCPCVRR